MCLSGLRHRSVSAATHQNRAVHLSRAGDHILSRNRRDRGNRRARNADSPFHTPTCAGRNRDAARFLFRRVVNRIERPTVIFGLCLASTLVIAAVKVVFP
jgi:hypothetical protein